MKQENVVVIDHLQKNFGKTKALRNVTFTVGRGEVFGFIGPNGAGKSTTIRTLLGMLRATSGRATIFGQDVYKDAVAIHERIAYVPGDVYLWPNLTGGEIIDMYLRLNKHARTPRTEGLIRQFKLDPSKKARTYSKGNRQKVALIAALAVDADLYIFDEPTSGLDPLMEQVFQKNVLALKEQGKSVLLSSHILSEVDRMCDHIGIIRDGAMVATGALAEMRHLTRTVITVSTSDPIDDLASWAGVYQMTANPNHPGEWTLAVDSDLLPTLMGALGVRGVTSIQSTPPTLEDLFMRYYAGTNEGERDAAK